MNVRLHPPPHSLPDNIWHTLMLLVVSAFFVWQTGQQVSEIFLADGPRTLVEQQLLEGEGHPLQVWIVSLAGEEMNPLLWNRILASCGWLCTLIYICRALKSSVGFVGSLPSALLLFTFPGLSFWMCSAGSGSWAIFFFLKGFYMVSGNETQAPLVRGGVMIALASLIHPIWILPSLGVMAGCWEGFRYRLKWVATGFGAVLGFGFLIYVVGIPHGGAYLLMGPAFSTLREWSWGEVFLRHLLLCLNLLLLLVYGSRRRGIGWWTLVCSLPLLFIESFLHADLASVLIPLWVFSALGLAKLPVLLDLRFPRSYQTFLLCQFLLWMPVYLGNRPCYIYPSLPTATLAVEAP